MTVTPFGNKKLSEPARPSPPIHSVSDFGQSTGGSSHGTTGSVTGVQNPSVIYQYIQDLCAKRISTLDYLRKAQEGQIYWFNTILFDKHDISKLPSFDPKKLSRRATNYLLLGLSLPILSDVTSHHPLDYLRSLCALLVEFEAYQQVHPSDGSSMSSSLSRARIPVLIRWATHGSTGKGRRTSSATEIGLPLNSGTTDFSDVRSVAGGGGGGSGNIVSPSTSTSTTATTASSSLPANDPELLPGEDYAYLSTPFLPFDPDFHQAFATLCDVLIDSYSRIMALANSPLDCNQAVADMFTKVDAKIRKLIIGGLVKDFEDASRTAVKVELTGVGKVVLGGLR